MKNDKETRSENERDVIQGQTDTQKAPGQYLRNRFFSILLAILWTLVFLPSVLKAEKLPATTNEISGPEINPTSNLDEEGKNGPELRASMEILFGYSRYDIFFKWNALREAFAYRLQSAKFRYVLKKPTPLAVTVKYAVGNLVSVEKGGVSSRQYTENIFGESILRRMTLECSIIGNPLPIALRWGIGYHFHSVNYEFPENKRGYDMETTGYTLDIIGGHLSLNIGYMFENGMILEFGYLIDLSNDLSGSRIETKNKEGFPEMIHSINAINIGYQF